MIEPFNLNALPDGEGLRLPSVNVSIWSQILGRSVVGVHSSIDREVLQGRIGRIENGSEAPYPWGWNLDIEFDTGLLLCFWQDEFLQSIGVYVVRNEDGLIDAETDLLEHQAEYIPWDRPPFSVPPEATHLIGNPITGVSLYQRFLPEDGFDASAGRPIETALCFELTREPNVFLVASMHALADDPSLHFDTDDLRKRLKPIGHLRMRSPEPSRAGTSGRTR